MVAIAFVLVLFVKEVPLRQVSGLEAQAAEAAEAAQAAGLAASPAPATEAADATDGAAPAEEAAPGPQGTAVAGRVRDGDGSPVAQAVVTLIDVGGRQLDRAVCDEEGRYAVEAPTSGTYVLIGSAGTRQPQAATVVVGETAVSFDLTLGGAAGLTGAVLDVEGVALPGALVVVTDFRGEVVASGAAGPDGGFAFGELVPGAYTLAVSADGHRPAALQTEAASGTPNWYEVQLVPGARVGGTVRSDDGSPLDDARVTLLDPAGNVVGTATTGSDGSYGFTDLEGGDYTVVASGYAPVATPVRLEAEGREDFDVELDHGTAD